MLKKQELRLFFHCLSLGKKRHKKTLSVSAYEDETDLGFLPLKNITIYAKERVKIKVF